MAFLIPQRLRAFYTVHYLLGRDGVLQDHVPLSFSQCCAINKSQEMGEAGELIFLVSSGLHLGRLQVERTAGPRALRVVRGRAGPLPGHQEWLQREHGKSSRQAGVGPPSQDSAVSLPERPLRSRRKHKAGWSVTAWALC
uniref:Uncharacterized protein n=1 Tax=Myotis myotis TaxID=51298 RepID=A0A7J7R012_MYOMY|nr:hypothetical protein mMyoMyo1_011254 [Myotis myotis]